MPFIKSEALRRRELPVPYLFLLLRLKNQSEETENRPPFADGPQGPAMGGEAPSTPKGTKDPPAGPEKYDFFCWNC